MNIDNLEKMIQQYSKQLLEMGKLYGGEEKSDNEEAVNGEETAEEQEAVFAVAQNISQNAEEEPSTENQDGEEQGKETDEPLISGDDSEAELLSKASFVARVFAGEEAYPVIGAKVVVYRGDKIFAFLMTDSNGATQKVTLPAFSKENSLEAESKNQQLDYYADVFAQGFVPKKELLVSAVGSSDIVLDVLLTPESEKVN